MKTALKWIIGIVVVATIGIGGYLWFSRPQTNANAAVSVQTAQVTRDTIQVSVSSNGTVQPAADLSLTFGGSGTVSDVKVKVGQRVQAGDVLATIDDSQLQLAVQQSAASLSSAQASLEKTKAGATPKEIVQAQASLDSAKAKYNQTKTGSYSASDLASAKAALDSARAKLAQLKAGPTAADVAAAQSSLDTAKLKLQQAQQGNATAQELASAKASLDTAKLKLQQAQKGNATAAELANAQSTLDSAKAKLAQVQAGPTQAELSAAQLKVTNAQTSYDKTVSQQQANVDSAKIARDQADNAVLKQQANLQSVYAQTHDSAGNFKSDPANQPDYYENQYAQAQRDLNDAYGSQTKAAAAYNDAIVQQKNGVAAAQASLDDAKKQLNETLHPSTYDADLASAQAAVSSAQANLDKLTGSTGSDVAIAQANVDSAQANYDKLTKGSSAADIAIAQASVKSAQANLDKLYQPATADTLAAAQASVASAQASYDKMLKPATQDDLTQAQAAVDQAQATLDDLKNGPTQTDLTAAMASVEQAQATLQLNKLKLANAVITAPFAGVVNTVGIVNGQSYTSGTAIELIDDSSYRVDLSVGESDVARLAVGQDVKVTFDALGSTTISGKVTFIASKSTVQSNVVSYLTTITIDGKAAQSIRAGMTANAEIIAESRSNALLVPSKAVRTVSGQKVVTVRSGGQNKDVNVTIGLTSGQYTEITGGDVAEGDTVVLTATTSTPTNTGSNRGGGAGILGGGPGR